MSIAISLFAGCGIQTPQQSESGVSEVQTQETQPDEPQTQPDELIAPEQLISKEEAQMLIGESVEDGEETVMETVGQIILLYDSAEEGSFASLQISLTQQAMMPQGSTITPEEVYSGAKAGLDETSDVDISGIGDECFTGTPGLHIVKDGYYIVIAAGNTDDPKVQDILKEAGRIAVENLEQILKGQ